MIFRPLVNLCGLPAEVVKLFVVITSRAHRTVAYCPIVNRKLARIYYDNTKAKELLSYSCAHTFDFDPDTYRFVYLMDDGMKDNLYNKSLTGFRTTRSLYEKAVMMYVMKHGLEDQ